MKDASTMMINGEIFDVVKPTRLLPGMVLKSRERAVFARIGPKEAALQEQIHTTSLYERGFPVAKILGSGEYDDKWYFIEESLGEETFHAQFVNDYATYGKVRMETFARYASIVERYIIAQYAESNRTGITSEEFIATAIPNDEIYHNYLACGGDIDRYHQAMIDAATRLATSPMGILQLDLNPFNVLDHGMIDFELVGYGPLGYDCLLVSLWHRWFSSDQTSKYRITYYLSDTQINTISHLVAEAAKSAHVNNPLSYMQEFLLIKTAWAFTSRVMIEDEPVSKQAFYRHRATLLSLAVENYLARKPIDILSFPDIRATNLA